MARVSVGLAENLVEAASLYTAPVTSGLPVPEYAPGQPHVAASSQARNG
jgi:hypothetical protein